MEMPTAQQIPVSIPWCETQGKSGGYDQEAWCNAKLRFRSGSYSQGDHVANGNLYPYKGNALILAPGARLMSRVLRRNT